MSSDARAAAVVLGTSAALLAVAAFLARGLRQSVTP